MEVYFLLFIISISILIYSFTILNFKLRRIFAIMLILISNIVAIAIMNFTTNNVIIVKNISIPLILLSITLLFLMINIGNEKIFVKNKDFAKKLDITLVACLTVGFCVFIYLLSELYIINPREFKIINDDQQLGNMLYYRFSDFIVIFSGITTVLLIFTKSKIQNTQ